jgi:hypothetical protein
MTTISSRDMEHVRRLSDCVILAAQMGLDGPLNDVAWGSLFDAALMLRELAGLPPPWDDPENLARLEAYMRAQAGFREWMVKR